MLAILFCVFANWTSGLAQSQDELPKLIPSYRNDFFQKDVAFSNTCFDNVFLDDSGRMWLNVCGLQRVVNSIGLYSFDGYIFRPLEFRKQDNSLVESINIKGRTLDGHFYGIADRQPYLLDPLSKSIETITYEDTTFKDLLPRGIQEINGVLYVIGEIGHGKVGLFGQQNERFTLRSSFDYRNGYWTTRGHSIVGDEEELWWIGGTLPLFRLDQKQNITEVFDVDDFLGETPTTELSQSDIVSDPPKILKSTGGEVYLFLSKYYGSNFYRFECELRKFVPLNEFFPKAWTPINLVQDQSGNVCFLFLDENRTYRAILQNSQGQYYDYSAVVAGHQDIRNLVAQDFFKQVYLLGNDGLHSIGIKKSGAIEQVLSGEWISSMIFMPDHRLLVNTISNGWFQYDTLIQKVEPFIGPDCNLDGKAFGKGMKQQILSDDQGNFWFVSSNYLVKYNPKDNSCFAYQLNSFAQLFAFVRPDLIMIQFGPTKIELFNLNTKSVMPPEDWLPSDLVGFVRDIFVDSRGLVWVPTNKGLWKLDFDQKKSVLILPDAGFRDFRFTAIFEDPQGRLWLGTYFGGLHIYDPATGETTVIDQRNGLSNNSVMGIIDDDDGDVWVTTEYGITILSPEGDVLNNIFQEDGLTIDQFERFDPYKAENGNLFFGSHQGLNIIRPRELKEDLKNKNEVKIYLTEAIFFDKQVGKVTIHRDQLEKLGTLEISAENPGLYLKFGLSSYLEPFKNRYAYKLDRKGEDWAYLGTTPELNISRLPPGRYNILVRGADFRNNWTTEPLVIPIRAKQFFYKQTWFYLLAAAPFLLFGFVWIRNKQQESRRLEIKVAVQTQKIQEDKELIEQQAEGLRQLDKLKSNFFTNISHELRTPITLIKAPLENIIEKYGHQMEKTLVSSLQLVLTNAGKLSRLVEELLELSRLDAKKTTLKEKSTAFSSFCEQLFNAYAAAASLKKINYRFKSQLDDNLFFLVDRNRLEKVINNLLSNALKFTPEEGNITMEIDRSPDQLFIQVQDSGRGIPPEDLPHLFERYFQTRRDDISTAGGTGIGLALTKELTELMGGQVSVESEWGSGTTFRVSLPAKEATATKEKAVPVERGLDLAPAIPASSFAKAGNTASEELPKILIVEDNPEMQLLIQSILMTEYDCLVTQDGLEAWTLLEKEDAKINEIELILSDIMMPRMDGYGLLAKLKAHDRWRNLPVVMLTARAAEDDKLQALRMGVDDYLMKPFSPQELKARLRNLIQNFNSRKAFHKSNTDQPSKVDIEFEVEASANDLWLQEIEQAAKEALDKGIKLTTNILAEKVFLSERQFARRLKSLTGLAPNAYIQEVKLQKARTLLENQVYMTINEVADASGYSSGSYLTKSFQERFGKKPSEYLLN